MKKNIFTLICSFFFFLFSFWIVKTYFFSTFSHNLILISVDTLRADHMGIYGYEKNTTPNLDKWAKNAMVYENAYTITPETLHSFYAFFTGDNGILENKNMTKGSWDKNILGVNKLTQFLKDEKYYNAAFVTNPVIGKYYGKFFSQGFDEYMLINKAREIGEDDEMAFNYDEENAKNLTTQTVRWLQKNKEKKFFLWLHYSTPHMPYNPSEKYICSIDKNCNISEYKNLLDEKSPYSTILRSCVTSNKTPRETIEKAQNLYDAEILSNDEQIGIILDEIKNLQMDKNSVIVFYGDHGEGFDHNIFGHTNALYDSAIRIPFIIKRPGYRFTSRIKTELIDNTNMMNILKESLGIANKQKNPARKYIYAFTPADKSNKFSVFDGTYKYIYSNNNTCLYNNYIEEMYNLTKDPEEKFNVFKKEIQTALDLKEQLFLKFDKFLKNNQEGNEDGDIIEKMKSLGY